MSACVSSRASRMLSSKMQFRVGDLVSFHMGNRRHGIIIATIDPGSDVVPYDAGLSHTDRAFVFRPMNYIQAGARNLLIESAGKYYRLSHDVVSHEAGSFSVIARIVDAV